MKSLKKHTSILIIMLMLIIVIVLYLLILNLGYIKNHGVLTPTGNVDIFEIDCNCKDDNCNNDDGNGNNDNNNNININGTNTVSKEDISSNKKPVSGESDSKVDKDKPDIKGIFVSDNYSMWGNHEVRIFSNPAYEYTSKIAPGSSNSYTFVIKNNIDYDVLVDLEMLEENPYKVNMKYKLRSKGKYLAGNDKTYVDISELQLKNVKIKAHQSVSYILDWKWIDSANDTEIGEKKIDANYKLTINVGANQS